MMSDSVLEGLQQANRNLRQMLLLLQQDGLNAARKGLFGKLRAQVSQADACLRRTGLDTSRSSQTMSEISQYRRHLQQITQILPVVHGRLLAEKARLQIKRARHEGVQVWVDAQQKNW
jgi:hypothetical protein